MGACQDTSRGVKKIMETISYYRLKIQKRFETSTTPLHIEIIYEKCRTKWQLNFVINVTKLI